MTFGERITRLRKQRKWTQEDVAKKLNISRSAYAGYETNRRVPEYATLEKLADLFEISIDYLVGRDEDRRYEVFLRAIKEKYPGVNIDDPEIQKKLMKVVDLVLEDYQQKRQQ